MTPPTRKQIRRWQRHLANERAEAAVYRELAFSKEGAERDILLAIADAELRHEEHWRKMLGNYVGMPQRPDLSTQFLGFMAKRFGSVFTLALMQSAETRTPYAKDEDATEQMIADERIHAEIVRGLAARGREEMSGNFRAAVFGANDGLVSNLALVLGVMAAGVDSRLILLTGISGLLSGALSMGAGEYVSVCSQKELLEASTPDPETSSAVPRLDVDANELALVYRARGMGEDEAERKARRVFAELKATGMTAESPIAGVEHTNDSDVVGSGWSAAISSFMFFATGALVPVLPFLLPIDPLTAGVAACVLVGVALMITGSIVGVLSGVSPWKRGLRQLAIGLGAAAVTYALGRAFGVAVG
ncbi:VIT1/CCC1 transporter family protein [Corynebacterium sp.]|uniref:VIT1/CCC1 transporter family protein n=1 Tax=Corynebacterium sp. TaxID=1720 RepID=UPI0026DB6FEC|nr:VIT1/CCC1 transporter family protein [Corynebacterium sp.]MDO5076041.1 VIT1/CCC1 transporter family protein [Corynebacterium sp.]